METVEPKSETFTTKRPLGQWLFWGGILTLGILFVSVQRTNSQQQSPTPTTPTTEETATEEKGDELATDSPKEQNELIEAYGLACSEQIAKLEGDRQLARVNKIWTQAQEVKAKTKQDPEKFVTKLLLDNLKKAKAVNAGAEAFSGSSEHNSITRDISTELVAINETLRYLREGKTPPSVDVKLNPAIEHCEVYGSELWQEINNEN